MYSVLEHRIYYDCLENVKERIAVSTVVVFYTVR